MGKKRPYRGRKVPSQASLTVGALASKDVIAGAMLNAAADDIRLLSLDGTWAVNGLTVGQGPVAVGVADGDYTAAEIEEALEAAGAIDLGDKLAQEKANRYVRQIAVCSTNDPIANQGRPIKTRLNWRIASGDSLQMWAYNLDTQTITTGGEVKFSGHANITFPS